VFLFNVCAAAFVKVSIILTWTYNYKYTISYIQCIKFCKKKSLHPQIPLMGSSHIMHTKDN